MKLAGLTEDVLLETKIQDEIKEEIFPKYKLIASHSARRTFIMPMFSVEYQSTEYARPPVTQIVAHLRCTSVRTLTDIIFKV